MSFKTPLSFIFILVFVIVLVSFSSIIFGETFKETDANITETAENQLSAIENFTLAGISIISVIAFFAVLLLIVVALLYVGGLFH